MSNNLSQDIKSLFASFEVEKPKYNELVEKERYRLAKKKWPAMNYIGAILSDSKPINPHQ